MLEIAFWCGIGRQTMKLIDADKLLEETRRDRDYARKNGFLDMYYERQVLIDRIKEQPTAYDQEKVVEQLEDYKRIKMLIPIEQALKAEYNKAIDDFIKAVDKHCGYYAGECKNLTRDDILGIANNMKLKSDG